MATRPNNALFGCHLCSLWLLACLSRLWSMLLPATSKWCLCLQQTWMLSTTSTKCFLAAICGRLKLIAKNAYALCWQQRNFKKCLISVNLWTLLKCFCELQSLVSENCWQKLPRLTAISGRLWLLAKNASGGCDLCRLRLLAGNASGGCELCRLRPLPEMPLAAATLLHNATNGMPSNGLLQHVILPSFLNLKLLIVTVKKCVVCYVLPALASSQHRRWYPSRTAVTSLWRRVGSSAPPSMTAVSWRRQRPSGVIGFFPALAEGSEITPVCGPRDFPSSPSESSRLNDS